MAPEKPIEKMSVKELKVFIDKAGFSHAGAFETDELRKRAREAAAGKGVAVIKPEARTQGVKKGSEGVRERRVAAKEPASSTSVTTAEEHTMLEQVLALVAESGKVRGRDATDILADAEKLKERIEEASFSEVNRKKMLDNLLDVDKNLAFEKHFEKYCAKLLKFGFLAMTVVPAVVTFLEWAVEFYFRPDMSVVPADLVSVHAVVTGGCGAVGLELAIMLAKYGAGVAISCHGPDSRDLEDVEARLKRMGLLYQDEKKLPGKGWVDVWPLELVSFSSVRDFAGRVVREMGTLDILVHSAATKGGCNRTEDGHELSTQVNYLSPFLLTQLLIPALRSQSGRVVYVTCDVGLQQPDWLPWPLRRTQAELMPRINVDGLQKRGKADGSNLVAGDCSPLIEYANAKLAIVAHSHELNRYLTSLNKGVAHVVNPGHLDSNFGSSDSAPTARASARSSVMGYLPPIMIANKIYSYTVAPLVARISNRMLRSTQNGAKAIFHVATAPVLGEEEHGGGLFADTAGAFTDCGKHSAQCGRVPRDGQPAPATDVELASVCWEKTKGAIGYRHLKPLSASAADAKEAASQASEQAPAAEEMPAKWIEEKVPEKDLKAGRTMTIRFSSDQGEQHEIGFNGARSMAALFEHYCKHAGIPRHAAHFTIWGQDVDLEQSVEETWNGLQLSEDDVIDVAAN